MSLVFSPEAILEEVQRTLQPLTDEFDKFKALEEIETAKLKGSFKERAFKQQQSLRKALQRLTKEIEPLEKQVRILESEIKVREGKRIEERIGVSTVAPDKKGLSNTQKVAIGGGALGLGLIIFG